MPANIHLELSRASYAEKRACSSAACQRRIRVRGRDHQLPKSTRLSELEVSLGGIGCDKPSLAATGWSDRPTGLRKSKDASNRRPRSRLYFITPRDIRNIASKCRVDPGRLHHLDTGSVQRRVDANLQSDGIQFYRPARDASGDGFVLVVINPTQKEWLRKYGQRALTTVIVADEWDRALPAAYLLSYRMIDIEVGMMFEHVKKLLPSFHTDYFITDDTNTFWNGSSKVFPSSWTKRLLCLWHVQLAMKRNANAKLVNGKCETSVLFAKEVSS
ncbi:hypothetical protein RB195_012143 [Necator americanus]|uniref:MULE transposase domain-containing protein n=1 Tax=Necator americanus TaxID=51031 RepID=A0ABR1D5Q2_NECAM